MEFMRWTRSIIGSLLLCTFLVGCRGGETSQFDHGSNKLKVLSTIAMIDDLVGQIGGEEVDHIVLIQGVLDPHSYELVKGDDEKFIEADVIFYNGLGLEHGASLRKTLESDANSVPIAELIVEQEPSAAIDIEGQSDPHMWMDVGLWAHGCDVIAERLARTDPAHAALYKRRGETAKEELLGLHHEIKGKLQAIPSACRYLVTSHDAFNYFARAYLASEGEDNWKERCVAPEGLTPEGRLSVADIRSVVNHLKERGVGVLFPESNLSRAAIKKILRIGREEGIEVRMASEDLYGDAMGEVGSDGATYESMMRHNARVITENLM